MTTKEQPYLVVLPLLHLPQVSKRYQKLGCFAIGHNEIRHVVLSVDMSVLTTVAWV